jgi:4-methyl-5(b-hydroxyethyl)-thiazole monophosphate biosynthesis
MIYVLLADGFEEIEALAPIDLLRRADLTVKTVSVMGRREVVGAHGITVLADLLPEEATDVPRLLFLPGGMPGASHLNESPITDEMIRRVTESGGHLAAICAAPFVLGVRGLLNGKRAVCFPGFEQYLKGATLVDELVVTDGRITTAKGMGAAVTLGLTLVRLLTDGQTADRIAAATFVPQGEQHKAERAVAAGLDDRELLRRAVAISIECGKVSTSLLQRKLLIGFGRAARLIDRMQELGAVGEYEGARPRTVLWTEEQYRAACESGRI